ncbi:DUF1707 SHOCT-like domain-containing protein [Agromyces archimandritae]|uniref:DUF1707 domain-containing protein n=1 Tax=Agromyces archimandritae TaxID=2781962 RepID=A0A975IMH3_9MICO|nr:DUF1707 domain-containing protein [Agromyces archimandritae]QTX03488.1 DUF1707 domain-containing protein [Agromyces archimandritae]
MSDSSDRLRLSTAEREAAVQRLAVARGEGRLSEAEFAERADAARAAVFGADLQPLFADLPPEPRVEAPLPPATPVASAGGGWGGASSRALGGSVGATIMALVPFIAFGLFLAFGFAGGWAWSWLFFLLVPIAGVIVYGPGSEDRARRRR